MVAAAHPERDRGASSGRMGPCIAAKTGQRVTTDSDAAGSKPAHGVTTDFGAELAPQPSRSPSASACRIHKEAIELGLSRGRNAIAVFQDLVDGQVCVDKTSSHAKSASYVALG